VLVWFLVMYLDGTCARLTEFTVVFSGILATYTVSFGLEIWIIVEGLKGAPVDTDDRSWIPWIIYLDTVSHIGQLAFNGAFLDMVFWLHRELCVICGCRHIVTPYVHVNLHA